MRDAILNNFWWKITALMLAILAWVSFQPEDSRRNLLPQPFQPYFTRHLISHPITVSKPATDSRQFKVIPSEVDITLSGEEKILRNLADTEVRATVEISDFKESKGETNILRIRLFVPPEGGIKLERMRPETVQVELLKE